MVANAAKAAEATLRQLMEVVRRVQDLERTVGSLKLRVGELSMALDVTAGYAEERG